MTDLTRTDEEIRSKKYRLKPIDEKNRSRTDEVCGPVGRSQDWPLPMLVACRADGWPKRSGPSVSVTFNRIISIAETLRFRKPRQRGDELRFPKCDRSASLFPSGRATRGYDTAESDVQNRVPGALVAARPGWTPAYLADDINLVTHADGSRGDWVFSGVCLFVCLFVFPHDNSKTAAATITKLDAEMFHL